MCIQNLDIRIKPLHRWASPKSPKIQIGTFWLYHEQQDAKGESNRDIQSIIIFYFSQSKLVFLPNWPL